MKSTFIISTLVAMLMLTGCKKISTKGETEAADYSSIQSAPLPDAESAETTQSYANADTTVHNTEEYDRIVENDFKDAKANPLSTFSIDVDNASYTNVRRIIKSGQFPEKGAVRIEEFINYFEYEYPQPQVGDPFSITTEVWDTPWAKDHQLVRIGLQGKKLDYSSIKPGNLVFLLDTSGSMEDSNKLPLLREAFMLMVDNLPAGSRVSIVTYAGSSGLVLPSTPIDEKDKIKEALSNLQAGGSTAGGDGLALAYKTAQSNFIENGNNRVILATDGDFNVGVSSRSGLLDLIEKNKGNEIFLTICGFGMGNYKDGTMEEISNWGDGNYFYIDSMEEARKVFQKELLANLFVIAKDVKIQVEFNPAQVQAYRLIGYENRVMANEDFNDDTKDAGELGAGHRVTALYEVVPTGVAFHARKIDKLKYQQPVQVATNTGSDLLTVKLRYKPIGSNKSLLIEKEVGKTSVQPGKDARFVSAVAGFGMLLRDSKYKGTLTYDMVVDLANSGFTNNDELKKEFVSLVKDAADLTKNTASK
jgi:Ca-activated chloride channel family protein